MLESAELLGNASGKGGLELLVDPKDCPSGLMMGLCRDVVILCYRRREEETAAVGLIEVGCVCLRPCCLLCIRIYPENKEQTPEVLPKRRKSWDGMHTGQADK